MAPGVVAVITSRVNPKFLGVGEDGAGGVGDTTPGQGRSWVALEGCEHLRVTEKRINKAQIEKNELSWSRLEGQGADLGQSWRDPIPAGVGGLVAQPDHHSRFGEPDQGWGAPSAGSTPLSCG